MRELKTFIESVDESMNQVWDCLDMFGASGRVAQTWIDAGYNSIGFDVKNDRAHDITAEKGFKILLRMALEFLVGKFILQALSKSCV